jgi:hypothetical protein
MATINAWIQWRLHSYLYQFGRHVRELLMGRSNYHLAVVISDSSGHDQRKSNVQC